MGCVAMSGGLSFFKAAVVYLFLGGLVLGPVAGDRARACPNEPMQFSLVVAVVIWPAMLGMSVTAGKLPKSNVSNCEVPL